MRRLAGSPGLRPAEKQTSLIRSHAATGGPTEIAGWKSAARGSVKERRLKFGSENHWALIGERGSSLDNFRSSLFQRGGR